MTSLTFDILAKDRASDKFDKVGNSVEGAGDKFKKFGAVAAAGLAIAGGALVVGGKYAFDHGAKLEAMAAKADTVFGKQVGQVNKWAEANANAMGLSSRETVGLASNFADLMIPMGFTRKEAAGMSKDVIGLSGALSQWSGGTKSAAEVSEILNAAMLGETDGLKALGISISQAEIQSKLLAKGQDKLKGSALAQATAQATQELIFAKSTDAQKKFADGGSPLLAAQAKLQGMFKDTRDELVMKLVPIMGTAATFAAEELGPALAKVGDWIKSNALPPIKDFIGEVRTGEGVGGKFANAFRTASDVLGTLAKFVNENRAAVGTFLGVIGTVIAVTKTWAVVQGILNAVMSANPIGIAVVALAALAGGLVYAYKKSETFREVVNASLEGAKTGFEALGKAGTWLWNNALQPTFKFIVSGVASILDMWSSMLGTLAKVPGFGWAKTAADAMANAANKARGLADNIEKIPDRKDVSIFVNTYQDTHKLPTGKGPINKAEQRGLPGRPNTRGTMPGVPTRDEWERAGRESAKGADDALKQVREKMKAKWEGIVGDARSSLEGLKSSMAAMASGVASAFNKDVFGGTLEEMMGGLNANGSIMTQALAQFEKLKGMGASTPWLTGLFQSGNAGLINELANSDAATVQGASALFGNNASLAQQLGDAVAKNDHSAAIAAEIRQLRAEQAQAPDKFAAQLGKVLNKMELVLKGGAAGQKVYLQTGGW